MKKDDTKTPKNIENPQAEIDRLKKEIEGLRGQSQVATLESEVDDLKKQKVNAQTSNVKAMTNIPGYDEEFIRLKEDAIKGARENKKKQIWTCLGSIVSIPVGFVIVYAILVAVKIGAFLEMDANSTNLMYWILAAIFIVVEIQTIIRLFKTIFINPEVIPDQTLSYLSLTAKEHLLDPKGSVIREKYGTAKWSAVTRT